MITIEELKKKFETLDYFANEELVFDTFNALWMLEENKINPGQDIYSICLEGPPGAGKTAFAKVYTKIASQIFGGNVEMVSYQCDATTGKNELFEDLNISAAIRGDADHVNVPGKLIEAIKKVNEGKKVILFIDEYDKAREETDAFLLQFLQDGKINSTQHGDLEVKPEYKANLQVVLCKNDMREELSGPLSRRIRIIRLTSMKPKVFYDVAHRLLIDKKAENEKISDKLLDLVSLIYQTVYDNEDIFKRLPSCSEMLIALEDADRLMKYADAPQSVIYTTLIKNMFKSKDDIATFESLVSGKKDEYNLSDVIKTMKSVDNSDEKQKDDLEQTIANNLCADKIKDYTDSVEKVQKLITTYKSKFENLEKMRRAAIENDLRKVNLINGDLVPSGISPNLARCFEDSTMYIKRGENVFALSDNAWSEIATITAPTDHFGGMLPINYMINHAADLDVVVYENGMLIYDLDGIKFILIRNTIDKNDYYQILANYPVISSGHLEQIENILSVLQAVVKSRKDYHEEKEVTVDIHALVYDTAEHAFTTKEAENVQAYKKVFKLTKEQDYNNLHEELNVFICYADDLAKQASKDITGKARALKK